ncbi:uncharacterized protein EDB91DRAFT_1238664 [Suillus paluster]|uniref:uncharacterized protein n=1 Tax=Suillus paluster TaxID=48578 RepID=UPI001B85E405|nr:uncharacterized protein EDB91DRAFT_1238664 [Suillus paluster]KAG1733063.1 hypothetical protein EDB91DRAFT_1238664 [Suillus paluster]
MSPIYVLFDPIPVIQEVNKHHAHVFKCSAKGCKVTIRRFLDKKDACSTVLQVADDAKSAAEVWTTIVASGKGKVTYSHRQHTCTESKAEIVKWVSKSLRPFDIVKDQGFQCLMKTGRPEIYIPSPLSVLHDVCLVFARTRARIAKMFKVTVCVHLELDGVPLTMPLDIVEVVKLLIYLAMLQHVGI